MAQARCANGHIYDSEIYDHCPYCDRGNSSIDFDSDFEKTLPVTGNTGGYGYGMPGPAESVRPEVIKKTTAPSDYVVKQETVGHTTGVFTFKGGKEPVVGWLVCVKGEDFGKDYRLLGKTNTIGRGASMDVQISGDTSITSDVHAKIDYDSEHNDFYLLPGNNKNTIYLNMEPVYSAKKLEAYARMRFGKTELLFVPFCCERFTWPMENGDN
ncbi:MAG: FHA domain-containing protein [Oscillospiraceae bacterium]|nr:FHA domain-containing protein [Oscillospiraceae bacterium]